MAGKVKAVKWTALVLDNEIRAVYPKASNHVGSNPNGSMKPWFTERGYRLVHVLVTPIKPKRRRK